jgi:hypothetical protein
MTNHLSERLSAYLESWHAGTVRKKREAGYEVTLTFQQFVALFEEHQLASLQRAIDADRLRYLQDEHNPFAYVATWRSYDACSTGIYSAETACICSRQKSKAINKVQKGSKLRQTHREAISRGLTGKARSEEAKEAISAGKKGVPIAPWSEERKAARSAARKAQEAAKRATR